MIGARRIGDAEVGAGIGGMQFGHQLLEGIGLVTKAVAELSCEEVIGACVMTIMPISA